MLSRTRTWPTHLTLAAILIVGAFVSVMTPDATASAASSFQPLRSPARILDTRSTGSTVDGRFTNLGAVGPNEVVRVRVTGRQGVPADAVAAMLNVTAVDPAGPGFLTVFPCGANRPNASTVNYFGAPVANSSIAAIGNRGSVCIYSSNKAHVLADISGYFPVGAYRPLSEPKRMLDTRNNGRTIDGRREAIGRRTAGQTTALQIGGRGGVGPNAPAVALNVTAIDPNAAGFLSVFPCGSRQTDASNVNYQAGQTVPNMVVAKLNDKGRVCIYTKASAHLAVDVSGVLPTTSFRPLGKPQRLADTRAGGTTTDGRFSGGGAIARKGTLQLTVNGRANIPEHASAAILNVTAVAPPAPGFLAVFPRGTIKPTVSNVNYGPGAVVANSAVARIGANGQICVFARTDAHVIVDVVGWLTGPAPPTSGAECPEAPSGPHDDIGAAYTALAPDEDGYEIHTFDATGNRVNAEPWERPQVDVDLVGTFEGQEVRTAGNTSYRCQNVALTIDGESVHPDLMVVNEAIMWGPLLVASRDICGPEGWAPGAYSELVAFDLSVPNQAPIVLAASPYNQDHLIYDLDAGTLAMDPLRPAMLSPDRRFVVTADAYEGSYTQPMVNSVDNPGDTIDLGSRCGTGGYQRSLPQFVDADKMFVLNDCGADPQRSPGDEQRLELVAVGTGAVIWSKGLDLQPDWFGRDYSVDVKVIEGRPSAIVSSTPSDFEPTRAIFVDGNRMVEITQSEPEDSTRWYVGYGFADQR